MTVRLHVNVDHVATLRQARGTSYPDPLSAARLCEDAGADGITVHLREDRRHIQDADVDAIRAGIRTVMNLEMALTEEMLAIAERVRPQLVTLVPERREERTTEGGLRVVGRLVEIGAARERLDRVGVALSLFIDPDPETVAASAGLGVHAVELHTGDYCHAADPAAARAELARLVEAAEVAREARRDLIVAAGHGLTVDNVGALVAAAAPIEELNIGHALVADAVSVGLPAAVRGFQEAIVAGVRAR